MAWQEWIRTVEIEPSLYAADFAPPRRADRRAPAHRRAHLPLRRRRRALRRADHDRADRAPVDRAAHPRGWRGARLPPDGRQPAPPLPADRHAPAATASPSTTRSSTTCPRRSPPRASTASGRRRLQPRERARGRRGRRGRRRPRALHEHPSRLQRPEVHAGGARPDRAAARGAARARPRPGRRRDRRRQRSLASRRRRDADRRRRGDLRRARISRGAYRRLVQAPARELRSSARSSSPSAAAARSSDHPLVGAVVVRDGEVVGEGWYEYEGVTPRRGDRARAGGRAGARRDALRHARAVLAPRAHAAVRRRGRRGRRRARRRRRARSEPGRRRPRRRAARRRGHRGRAPRRASPRVARTRRGARGSRSAVRSSPTRRRSRSTGASPFPAGAGSSGEESRRRVHELRAASDAVAVGMGTVRADAPRLDARDVGAARQPRRLAFGRGPLPDGSRARAAHRLARRGAARARRRGRPVAAARGRPDARDGVPRGRSRRQAAPLRRARRSPATGRASSATSRRRSSCSRLPRDRARRGRAARGVRARDHRGGRLAPPSAVRRESLLRTTRPVDPVAVFARTQLLRLCTQPALRRRACLYREPRNRLRETRTAAGVTFLACSRASCASAGRVQRHRRRRRGLRLRIDAPATAAGVAVGDSVAVARRLPHRRGRGGRDALAFDAVPETLSPHRARTPRVRAPR